MAREYDSITVLDEIWPHECSLDMNLSGIQSVAVIQVRGADWQSKQDDLTVEEPLTIQLTFGPPSERNRRNLAITMRTPGDEADLAAGYLHAEGIVRHPRDILAIETNRANSVVRVDLHPDVRLDWTQLERTGVMSSSCGLCGKTSVESISRRCESLPTGTPRIRPGLIQALPGELSRGQSIFTQTGGIHAAALFDLEGRRLSLREDVGRHNALDKLFGAAFRAEQLPLHDRIVLVSARASFELVQKAAVAGVPIFVAVGAPSSLAVQLANELGLTLIGFAREGRFNIYSGAERILPAGE